MAGSEERRSQRLSHLPPTFNPRAGSAAALSPRDLATLREAGKVDELSRGVYRRAGAGHRHLYLLAVCSSAG